MFVLLSVVQSVLIIILYAKQKRVVSSVIIHLFVGLTEICATVRYKQFLSTNINSRSKLHSFLSRINIIFNLRAKFLS